MSALLANNHADATRCCARKDYPFERCTRLGRHRVEEDGHHYRVCKQHYLLFQEDTFQNGRYAARWHRLFNAKYDTFTGQEYHDRITGFNGFCTEPIETITLETLMPLSVGSVIETSLAHFEVLEVVGGNRYLVLRHFKEEEEDDDTESDSGSYVDNSDSDYVDDSESDSDSDFSIWEFQMEGRHFLIDNTLDIYDSSMEFVANVENLSKKGKMYKIVEGLGILDSVGDSRESSPLEVPNILANDSIDSGSETEEDAEETIQLSISSSVEKQCRARIWGTGSGFDRCSRDALPGCDLCGQHKKQGDEFPFAAERNEHTGSPKGLYLGKIGELYHYLNVPGFPSGVVSAVPIFDRNGLITLNWSNKDAKEIVKTSRDNGAKYHPMTREAVRRKNS